MIKWSRKQMKEILNADNTGVELARKYGVSEATIHHIRKDNGIVSKRHITSDQRKMLEENYFKCSIAQLSEFTGVSKTQIMREVRRLKDSGVIPDSRKRYSNAFEIGKLGILVAKSCNDCGNLLPADWYHRNKAGYWSHICKRCSSDKIMDNRAERNGHSKAREYLDLMRRITLPLAVNNWKPLCDEDHRVLSDPSKSVLQKALEIGRTYAAVSGATSRFGYTNKGSIKKLPDPSCDVWVIHFPNAIKEIQEYYKRLGPVSESEWEWDEAS